MLAIPSPIPPDTPLFDVTFCALDLETTGGSAATCDIVEIGAIKSRGGEPLGTLETFVRPPDIVGLPVDIQMLTGIRPWMLESAPALDTVLPSVIEFLRGTVLVAHNARFDHSFLDAGCERLGYEPLRPVVLDTAKIARRLVKAEVPNVQLATLATHFRTAHTPNHRAFADAAACLEVLWHLVERASAYGVETLGDLSELQRPGARPHADKARLARDLPRSRGVYLFRDAQQEVLYVGKAADLRARVRSYFTTDDRKRTADLVALAAAVETIDCETDLEAQAIEARLIDRLQPRFNRQGVRRTKHAWLRIDTRQRHPRVQIVGRHHGRGLHIGPFSSRATAGAAAEVVTSAWGIRSCTLALTAATKLQPCALYDLRTCHGPCTGSAGDVSRHDHAVQEAVADLRGDASTLRTLVGRRLAKLADRYRFEDAAAHHARYTELARVLARSRKLRTVASWGTIEITVDGRQLSVTNGVLDAGPGQRKLADEGSEGTDPSVGAEHLLERTAVATWLDRHEWTFVRATRPPAMPWPGVRAEAEFEG